MICPRCESALVVRRPVRRPLNSLQAAVSSHLFECRSCDHQFGSAPARGPSSVTPQVDRRQFRRTPVNIPVCFTSGEGRGEGTITDISETGCRLDSTERLRAGLLLCLSVPVDSGAQEKVLLQQVATVRRVYGGGVGLRFVVLTARERRDLGQVIRLIQGEFGGP